MWLISAKFEREGSCKCNYIFTKFVKWQPSKKRRPVVLPRARQGSACAPEVCSCLENWWTCVGQPGGAGPDMSCLVPNESFKKMWIRKFSLYLVWWQSRWGRERSLRNQEKYLTELLVCKTYLVLVLFSVYFFAIECFIVTVCVDWFLTGLCCCALLKEVFFSMMSLFCVEWSKSPNAPTVLLWRHRKFDEQFNRGWFQCCHSTW